MERQERAMTAPVLDALDVAQARAATDRLRLTLTDAHEQLIELYRMRAHEALGYGRRLAGWTAYLAAEFGELLHVVPSAEQLAAMVDAGMTQREAAAPFRVSLGTVNAALQAHRAPVAPAPAPVSKVERVLALVAAAGPSGLTVEQLRRKTRWHHGSASAVLARLAAAGRITYRPGPRRGVMGTYVLPAAS
jgi:MarR family